MTIRKKSISRRAVLRGAGAALALPMLDAMIPACGFAAETKRPIRLSFIEVPNGIIMDKWTPATEGSNFALTPILEPLAAFRDRMIVVSGLDQWEAAGRANEISGDHPRACTAFLTGSHAKMTSGADLRAGISVDQVAAKDFGKYTQLASLEIGLESPEIVGGCEATYACAYYNTISWRNETTPLPMENRPRAVFERLFGDAAADPKAQVARTKENRSILDAVAEDAARLRGRLGGADRGKLEQYVEAVRDVERRIQIAEAQGPAEVPDMPELQGALGIPSVFSEYYKLMADLQVLAWQTDMTRVCTFQIGHEMSTRAYPEVGFGDAHHALTHHQGDAEKIAKTARINIFHSQMLAYFLEKLRSTPDGDGSLLDHALILYGSALSDGNIHQYTDLPLLLVAGGVRGIKGGRHVRHRGVPMTNLLLTMLDKADVPDVEKLGDSTGRLEI